MLEGKGIKIKEALEKGYLAVIPENEGHYMVDEKKINEAINSKADNGDVVNALLNIKDRSEQLNIFRDEGMEYKQFINVDELEHDSRLSDVQAERLRSIMNNPDATEIDRRVAVDRTPHRPRDVDRNHLGHSRRLDVVEGQFESVLERFDDGARRRPDP